MSLLVRVSNFSQSLAVALRNLYSVNRALCKHTNNSSNRRVLYHNSLNIFAKTMSSEENGEKPVGEVKTFENSSEESGAEGDSGKAANEHEASDEEKEESRKTQESNTVTGKINGGDNHKEKNTPTPEPVQKPSDKRELTNPDPNGDKGDQTSADECSKKCEQQSSPERERRPNLILTSNPGTKSPSSHFRLMGIFLAAAVACIAVAIYLGPPRNEVKTAFDPVRVFENGLPKLKLLFTNQSDRFWKILRGRGLAHLRNKDPSQPLVFLLAAPPAAHECVDCLATKLAELLDPRHKKSLARIDGENEKANPPNDTKLTMDKFLKEKIKDSHRVVLIHHLELLPPPSPLLFHSYCDDQNAPDKHLAILFTVHMPVEPSPSLSPKEAEGSVEKYLSGDVWAKDNKDAVASLLVRIADTVVLMNGETSSSARAICS